MKTELETKQRVDSIEEFEERLYQLGAEFVADSVQKDSYFDDNSSNITEADKCLRLRRQTSGRTQKAYITYKGPIEKGRFKQRQEIEIEIADADSMENILVSLGYHKTIVFEKRRKLYRLDGCEVALDDLPLLGCFVEIEGPDDQRIADVQQKLELDKLPNTKESYASLMSEKLRGPSESGPTEKNKK